MIRSLSMPASTLGENPLRFPLSAESGLGTVTVLCGPNGSGKSFILRMLKDLLTGANAAGFNLGHGWSADTTGAELFSSHRPHHHKSQKISVGMIAASRAGKKLQEHDHDLRVQVTIFGLLIQSLGTVPSFDITRWSTDPLTVLPWSTASGPQVTRNSCFGWGKACRNSRNCSTRFSTAD